MIGVLWAGPALSAVLLAPVWLGWSWQVAALTRAVGALALAASVAAGAWAMSLMGWSRLLLVPDLLPPGIKTEHSMSRRLVVEGPYRHVRHPLYASDSGVLLGAALLTQKWALLILAGVYLVVLNVQLDLEERQLEARFGQRYRRYRRLVPALVPRPTPVDPEELHNPRGEEDNDRDQQVG